MPKFVLVHNWKECLTWISTQCMIGAAAVQGAWVYIPDDLRASMPHGIVEGVTVSLLAVGFVGRIIKKELPDVDSADNVDNGLPKGD